MPKVTASIVIHRTPAALLDSIMESLLRCQHLTKIYIVENSPTPLLSEYSRRWPPAEYSFVENRGYGAAHNTAIRKALEIGTDYHLVVNPDVRWQGDALGQLVEVIEAHPEVAQLMPRTIYPDGSLQHVCRRLPSPLDMLLRLALPAWVAPKRRQRYLRLDCDYGKPMHPRYMLGSFMLFRAEALREVGLFDERFFMYPEDIDITRRMHDARQTLYWPAVTIIHDHARASRRSLRMMRIHIANMVRYFNKWGWLSDAGRHADWHDTPDTQK